MDTASPAGNGASRRSSAMALMPAPEQHYAPRNFRDRAAFAFIKLLRFFADAFFARRYGHRAVVLETVAAVPGMVGGPCSICALCA